MDDLDSVDRVDLMDRDNSPICPFQSMESTASSLALPGVSGLKLGLKSGDFEEFDVASPGFGWQFH